MRSHGTAICLLYAILLYGNSSYSLEPSCSSARSRRSATGLGARSFTGPHKSFVVEVPVHKQASEVVEREEVENEAFVVRRAEHGWEYLGDLCTESGQTLQGSFSAVSTPIFATKYSFFSIFRDLRDLQSFAPLRSQNFNKKSSNFLTFFTEFSANFARF